MSIENSFIMFAGVELVKTFCGRFRICTKNFKSPLALLAYTRYRKRSAI